MMPNVKGAARTRLEILLYSLLLAPVGATPWIMGFASNVYGAVSIVGGLAMIVCALQVYRTRVGDAANKTAMRMFGISILYLFSLFAVLVVENTLAIFLAGSN